MTGLNKRILNVIGWAGATTSLTAYSLNSHRVIESSSLVYLLMNLMGCTLLIIYTFRKGAYANAALNSIWFIVTLLALGTLLISKDRY